MPAARKHTTFAILSFLLISAFAVAGSAGGVQLPGKKDREAPSAPTNVRVTSATPTSVSLAWDASTDNVGVAFYYVYVDAARARVDGTTYTATNLECGQSIGVWIVAYDLALKRSTSATATVSTAACPDTQAPTPPSGFRQAATTETAVVLDWDRSSDDVGVVGYGVYQDQLPIQSPSEPTATLTGLVCGSTFEYQVDAVDAAGNRSARRSAWVQTARCAALPPPPADSTPPSQPANLTISSVDPTSVSLTWSPATDNVGVAGYDVYKNGTKMTYVTSTSSTQSGLACGTSYWFGVEAVDAAGNRSARIRTNATTSACSAPPSGGWTFCSYEYERCTFAGTKEVRYGENGVFTAPSVFSSVVSCTNDIFGDPLPGFRKHCDYRDLGGTPPPPSDNPPPDQTAPSQPTNLAIASVTKTSVSLTWGASTDNVGVAGYGVYANGNSVQIANQPGATVSGLSCGTAFTFAVDAFDNANNRSTKAQVTASTAACADTQAPTVPTNVAASSRTATSIALTWTASSDNVGVTGYGLYRGGTLVGTAAATTGIFSGLTCNTNYTLAVDAQDADGNRSSKATIMVATTGCADTAPPSSPTGLVASNVTQSGLTLTWNASTDNVGVAGYDVYRDGTKMASVTSTSSGQGGLACGTSYWFGVEALDAVGNRSARVRVNPTTSACPPPPPSVACSDAVDNDSDGKIDYPADPGCSSATDTDEQDPAPPPSSTEPAPIAGQGYSKTFADEFDTLDTNVWSRGIWYLPPPPAGDIYVQNSVLNLVSRRSTGYGAAHVTTSLGPGNTRSFRRGYFEARLKFTSGIGSWPAFWLFNTSWRTNATCPPLVSELDIFEAFPQGPNTHQHSGTLHRNTSHPGPCSEIPDSFNPNTWTGDVGFDLTAAFHVYAALWTQNEVIWYLDGREIKRAPTFDSTDQDMFLILNIDSQRGDFGIPAPDATTPDELRTEVDWVRVWQK